jgi:hypothetical protein
MQHARTIGTVAVGYIGYVGWTEGRFEGEYTDTDRHRHRHTHFLTPLHPHNFSPYPARSFAVESGHAAILYNTSTGLDETAVYGPGTHWKLPLLDTAIVYNLVARSSTFQHDRFESPPVSKDGHPVHLTSRVLYRPCRDQLPRVHRMVPTFRMSRLFF